MRQMKGAGWWTSDQTDETCKEIQADSMDSYHKEDLNKKNDTFTQ